MKEVVFSSLSELRNGSVLIGADCARGFEPQQLSIRDIQIVNPYSDHSDILKAVEFCWNVSRDTCVRLGDILNRVHGLDYGLDYWERIVIHWLAPLVESLYDRYLRLGLVRDRYPGAVLEIPRAAGLQPCLKSYDVMDCGYIDANQINTKIYLFLINAMGLAPSIKYLNVTFPWPSSLSDFTYYSFLRKESAGLYRRINFHSGEGLFLWYFSEKPQNIFSLSRKMGWSQWGCPIFMDCGFSKKKLLRQELSLAATDNEFNNILYQIIPKFFPFSLFEEYHDRRNTALRFLKKKNIKRVFVNEALWVSDTLKILVAEIKQRGGVIVGRQHGGVYGQHLTTTLEKVERTVGDYFITWGWNDKLACPAVPMPVPYLSGLANAHKQRNKDILFIGSHGPMYMLRYQSYWMPEFVFFKYYSLKTVFIKNLQAAAKERLLYRPYPHEYGWDERKRIREMLPGARFSNDPAILSMKRCSLVIIDHPSTSFLEALRMNVPSVFFWDNSQVLMRKDAEPYFATLVNAGILYYDPAAAAEKVNQICCQPMEWWKQKKIQDARIEFCDRFALTDKRWTDVWAKELRRFL